MYLDRYNFYQDEFYLAKAQHSTYEPFMEKKETPVFPESITVAYTQP